MKRQANSMCNVERKCPIAACVGVIPLTRAAGLSTKLSVRLCIRTCKIECSIN